MLNLLLSMFFIPVVGDTTSPDNIPGGVGRGLDIDVPSFWFGVIVAAIVCLLIIGIVQLTKTLVKEIKNDNERLNMGDKE